MAASLNIVALICRDQARYAEAEPLLQRALAIREKVLGPEHLDVATSLGNLAGLYESQHSMLGGTALQACTGNQGKGIGV